MKHLEHCVFCNKVIPIEELGLKDKDVGAMCKPCFEWLKSFIKLWRDYHA